jgi:hypothetical protein
MRKDLFYIFLLLCVSSVINGQDVNVTSHLDTSRIYIGDQIFYTISIEQPANISLDIKPLRDTLIERIEILSGPVQDTISSSDGRLKIDYKYLITSFDSGYYRIPPAYAEIRDEKGIKRFYSDYNPLEVMRLRISPPDTAEKIFDIIRPYRAPLTVVEILPWVLLAALFAAAVWGITHLIKKLKRSGNEPEIVINPDPAHVIAFRELERLKQEELWQKGEVKKYYSRLTEILRQYLENRFGVNSLEMTTSETLDALVASGFRKDDSYTTLKSVLNGADLVKFAKYKPESAENENNFDNSWRFVENTKVDVVETVSDSEIHKEGGKQ